MRRTGPTGYVYTSAKIRDVLRSEREQAALIEQCQLCLEGVFLDTKNSRSAYPGACGTPKSDGAKSKWRILNAEYEDGCRARDRRRVRPGRTRVALGIQDPWWMPVGPA